MAGVPEGLSALAAVCSAIAAFKANSLASAIAKRADATERRLLHREIDELSRAVAIECRRSSRVYARLSLLETAAYESIGAYGSRARQEDLADIAGRAERVKQIEQEAATILQIPPDDLGVDDLDDRVARLRAALAETTGLLTDGIDQTTQTASESKELRAARNRERG